MKLKYIFWIIVVTCIFLVRVQFIPNAVSAEENEQLVVVVPNENTDLKKKIIDLKKFLKAEILKAKKDPVEERRKILQERKLRIEEKERKRLERIVYVLGLTKEFVESGGIQMIGMVVVDYDNEFNPIWAKLSDLY